MSETKHPHGSRVRDALVIVTPGACNPSGIALSIVDACREIREHEPTASTAHDPAIRLMVYQLASIWGSPITRSSATPPTRPPAKIGSPNWGGSPSEPADQYRPRLTEVGGGRGVRDVAVQTNQEPRHFAE